jgi:hypothetical protein
VTVDCPEPTDASNDLGYDEEHIQHRRDSKGDDGKLGKGRSKGDIKCDGKGDVDSVDGPKRKREGNGEGDGEGSGEGDGCTDDTDGKRKGGKGEGHVGKGDHDVKMARAIAKAKALFHDDQRDCWGHWWPKRYS